MRKTTYKELAVPVRSLPLEAQTPLLMELAKQGRDLTMIPSLGRSDVFTYRRYTERVQTSIFYSPGKGYGTRTTRPLALPSGTHNVLAGYNEGVYKVPSTATDNKPVS